MLNADSCLELLRTRSSVRSYLPDSVESDKITRCLEAARMSPSACNAQPWTFVVVEDPIIRKSLAEAASGGLIPMNHFVVQAPVLIAVVCERPNFSSSLGKLLKNNDYPLIDNGMAVIQFCLQASAEGLGTCILGWFHEKKVKKLLGIPGNRRVHLMIALGYPTEDKKPRGKYRKPPEQMSCFNRYYRGKI